MDLQDLQIRDAGSLVVFQKLPSLYPQAARNSRNVINRDVALGSLYRA